MTFLLKNIFIRKPNGVVKKNCVFIDLQVGGIKGLALDSLGVPLCVCVDMCTLECVPVCVCVSVYTCVHLSVISLEPHSLCADGSWWSGQSRAGGLCSSKERVSGWDASSLHALWLEAHVSIGG